MAIATLTLGISGAAARADAKPPAKKPGRSAHAKPAPKHALRAVAASRGWHAATPK